MKWYEERYVNRRDWIIDNYEKFNLMPEEGLLCLVIDFLLSNNMTITYELLSKKTNLSNSKLDEIIALLVQKGFLKIKVNKKGISFSLQGLYEYKDNKNENVNNSVFEVFEQYFGRPLKPKELEKLNDLVKEYDSKLLVYALKEALTYEKISFPYIEAILKDWKAKGITSENYRNN